MESRIRPGYRFTGGLRPVSTWRMGNRDDRPATEARHPAAKGLHRLSGTETLRHLHQAQLEALGAVAQALPDLDRAATAVADALRSGHRTIFAGAGSSGLMALADALELAGTFGIAPDRTPILFAGGTSALLSMTGGVEDDVTAALADLARVGPGAGDVLVVVSASGATPSTLAVASAARAAGATVVGIANAAGSALLAEADIPVLLDTGPEVVAGSTRMGAGTAQKAALNMISTLVGIQLGHVHDGMMVNLTADNAKLADRAVRIVVAVAGCDEATAKEALARTGGAVKPATLIARGANPARAAELLKRSGGHLDPALATLAGETPD